MKKILRHRILVLFTLLFAHFFATAQCFQEISSGYNHSVALKPDGTLWAWGANSSGQIGNGDVNNMIFNSPIRMGTDSNWRTISAGNYHTVAIKTDGTLWAWGLNTYGQVGDGTTTNKNIPTQIGTDNNWSRISAAWDNTIAIKTDGTLWTWGVNHGSEFGDGSIFNYTIPTQVGTDSNWSDINAGHYHTLAIKIDGTLWTWGGNGWGELGDGTTTPKYFPIQIGTDTNWSAVSAGAYHSHALKSDGTLWSWGVNYEGEIGDGSSGINTDKHIPTQIGLTNHWTKIDAGEDFCLALTNNGTLWGWGRNYFGQLGNGSNGNSYIPSQIGAASNWTTISAGGYHSQALKADGTLWVCGFNNMGQLGTGNTPNLYVFTAIVCPQLSVVSVTSNETQVKIYPNPARNDLNIQAIDTINEITLTDCNGRIILTELPNNTNTTLNVNYLQTGIYFLKIATENGSSVAKIVKE